MVGFISITGYRRIETGISTTTPTGYVTVFFSKPFRRSPIVYLNPLVSSQICLVSVTGSYFVAFAGSVVSDYAGGHTHSIYGGEHTHSSTIYSAGDHTHDASSISTVPAHAHALATASPTVPGVATWYYHYLNVQTCALTGCFSASIFAGISFSYYSPVDHRHDVSFAGSHFHTVSLYSAGAHSHSASIYSQDHSHACDSAGGHSHSLINTPATISFRWIAVEW